MKKNFTAMLLLLAFLGFKQADAKIWRVNNNGYGATFLELQNANDSLYVFDGDTIHLEGSTVDYKYATITKKLVIIGPGYFLNENLNVSINNYEAKMSAIYFKPGSDGSQLIGVSIGRTSSGVNISASNIIIKRCIIEYAVSLYTPSSNIQIVQNFFVGQSTGYALNYTSGGFPTDVIFNNNICQKLLILNYNYTLLQCNNNVFDCPAVSGSPSIQVNTGSFRNNILKTPAATVNINNGTGTNVTHNISSFASNQFGTANNNIVVTNMTTLFVNPATNSTDGDYQLLANSPGSNNGSDNTDRGVFGGAAISNRYTLSGLAPIPVIYNITTTGVAGSTGLPVTIKAKTIK